MQKIKFQGGLGFKAGLKSSKFYTVSKKYHGIGSFHSKYVIIGGGFAGMTLLKLLTSVN